MEKAYGMLAIYNVRTRELFHSERVYSNFGPECAVHENAAQIYKFFADGCDEPLFAQVEMHYGDKVQHWTRQPEDDTFTMRWEA